MSDLENHFGDDASIDVETNKNILHKIRNIFNIFIFD